MSLQDILLDNFLCLPIEIQGEIIATKCLSFDIIFKMTDYLLDMLCESLKENIRIIVLYNCVSKMKFKTIIRYLKRIYTININDLDESFRTKILDSLLSLPDIYNINSEEIELLYNLFDIYFVSKFNNKIDLSLINKDVLIDCNKIIFRNPEIVINNLQFLENSKIIGEIYNNNIQFNFSLKKFFNKYLNSGNKILDYIQKYNIRYLTIEQLIIIKKYFNDINLNFLTMLDKDENKIFDFCNFLIKNISNKKNIKDFIYSNLSFKIEYVDIFSEIVKYLNPVKKRVLYEKLFDILNNKQSIYYNLNEKIKKLILNLISERHLEKILLLYKKLSLECIKFLVENFQDFFIKERNLIFLYDQVNFLKWGSETESGQCNICYETKELILLFGCSHLMCQDCIEKLRNNICPFCRKKLEKKNKLKIEIID